MKNENKNVGASLGRASRDLSFTLTMLFCALRACDVIAWKWYWVVSPLIASEIIGIIALVFAGALAISILKDK